MSRAVLAFGGNLGDVRSTFSAALRFLEEENIISGVTSSHIYHSKSLLKDGQPDYCNMAVSAETSLAAHELLWRLKSAEQKFGRLPSDHWQARTLDIDIIDYDGIILKSPDLNLPHAEMAVRSFVLIPMLDIVPEYVHPESGKSLHEMLALITDDLDIRRV